MKKNKERTLRLMIIDDNAENTEAIVTCCEIAALQCGHPGHST